MKRTEIAIDVKNPQNTFKPGDVITIYGWQDGKSGTYGGNMIERQAKVIKAYPTFLHVKFTSGQEETWNYWNLKYALNRKPVPDYYYASRPYGQGKDK